MKSFKFIRLIIQIYQVDYSNLSGRSFKFIRYYHLSLSSGKLIIDTFSHHDQVNF